MRGGREASFTDVAWSTFNADSLDLNSSAMNFVGLNGGVAGGIGPATTGKSNTCILWDLVPGSIYQCSTDRRLCPSN